MQKLIAIAGRTFQLSNQSPVSLLITSFSLTPVPTESPASRSRAHSQPILISQIAITCVYAGNFSATETYAATGSGSIVASTARVKCEGQSILTQGDSVTILLPGTVTTTASGATVPNVPSAVDVTLVDPGQANVFANKT